MGWNDIRVHLLANGVKASKTPLLGRHTDQGDPVNVVSFEAIRKHELPLYSDVVAVLEREGFRCQEKGNSYAEFGNGAIRSTVSQDKVNSERVLEVELEFVCSPTSISDLGKWVILTDTIAGELGLSPFSYESLTAFESSESAIRSTRTWVEFSEMYGWNSESERGS